MLRSQKPVVSDYVFTIANSFIMILAFTATLYPFWYILVGSISSISHVMSGNFIIWPDAFTTSAYQYVLRNPRIPQAYFNTIFITVVGTFISMVLTILGSYVLSKKNLPGRNAMVLFIVITILFNGGLIPFYLTVRSLGLIDSIWSLILPSCVSAYNIIIMRNFFSTIPSSIEESAQIDGANQLTILARIYLPLSLPVIATIILFYAVGYWNSFFYAIIFLNRPDYQPIQVLLREVLIQSRSDLLQFDLWDNPPTETVKMALVIIAIAPIIAVYPFLQKYFVKGMLMGSLKQ